MGREQSSCAKKRGVGVLRINDLTQPLQGSPQCHSVLIDEHFSQLGGETKGSW